MSVHFTGKNFSLMEFKYILYYFSCERHQPMLILIWQILIVHRHSTMYYTTLIWRITFRVQPWSADLSTKVSCNFQLNIVHNPRMLWFRFTTPCYWSRKRALLSPPLRPKTIACSLLLMSETKRGRKQYDRSGGVKKRRGLGLLAYSLVPRLFMAKRLYISVTVTR